jgi:purine nucleosidase
LVLLLLIAASQGFAQQPRKVIINQDCSGPGGSNMQTLLTLIQSPQVEVLGITVVSGNQWRDEEVAHTLRLLELIGRTDIPVVPGAVFPLVHRRKRFCGRHGMGKWLLRELGTIAGGTNMT